MPTKSISFKDKYEKQYEFLLSQDNPSQFVCELIKNYMENEDNFESRVEEIVSNYINKNFQLLSQIINIQPTLQNTQQIINTKDKLISEIEDPWG